MKRQMFWSHIKLNVNKSLADCTKTYAQQASHTINNWYVPFLKMDKMFYLSNDKHRIDIYRHTRTHLPYFEEILTKLDDLSDWLICLSTSWNDNNLNCQHSWLYVQIYGLNTFLPKCAAIFCGNLNKKSKYLARKKTTYSSHPLEYTPHIWLVYGV